MLPLEPFGVDEYDQEDEQECEILNSSVVPSQKSEKKTRRKGLMDLFVTPKANPKKDEGGVYAACAHQLRAKAYRFIARFFYDVRIAFNAPNYPSFKNMVEDIGQFGPGMKAPSMHKLRVPLLKKEVYDNQKLMEDHKKEWVEKGCSILLDEWCNSVVQKDIANFLVNSPNGSMFIKSMDVLEIVKDAKMLFQVIDAMVEEESFRPSSSKSAKEKNIATSSPTHGRDDEMEEDIGEDDFAIDEDYNDEFGDFE
ncbi:hypothetical protein V6N12_030897 [Hibiscus sabdariffa]|uniref:DUF659 domain-containing protein n=1 Tax=Hibiscus sabdariffa TaxID=183260 RepID=A0ABR2E7E9_9ROSI